MFYKKDYIKMIPLGLNELGQQERNSCVIKMSGLPLYCFARDLSSIATKLNAKMVHVPRLSNSLPGSTALFYFSSQKDMDHALTLNGISYQGRRVHLATLDKKTCFACGSAEHEIKSCKNRRVLRYPPSRQPITNRKQPIKSSSIATSSRSYASAIKSPVEIHPPSSPSD